MLWILNYSPITPLEQTIQAQNKEILAPLRSLAESDHFSKIRMSFNEKCPRATEKCSFTSCAVPQMEIQGKDGVIDLLKIRESYSTSTQGSTRVWMDIYDAVKDDELMKRVVSGLHFSVTTHLSSFHTKLFGVYFSNPLIFQKRFRQEYKDNFLFLYSAVRAAVANLEHNKGDVPQRVRKFGRMLRKSMMRERRARESKILSENGISEQKPSLAIGDRNVVDDVENDVDSHIVEAESSIVLDLPKIDKNAIETVNEIVRCVACLGCQKCRLWGTIQTKGLKAAIKSLNGMPLYKSDVIFLVNVFRRLSVSVEESQRLQRVRFPHLHLIVVCHKQIMIVTITLLSAVLAYQRAKRSRKIKCDYNKKYLRGPHMEKILATIKAGNEEDIARGITELEECTLDTMEMLVKESPSPRISTIVKKECQKRLLDRTGSKSEAKESVCSTPHVSAKDALDKCKFRNSKYDKALEMFFNSFKACTAEIDNLKAAKLSQRIVELIVDRFLDTFPKTVRSKSHNLRENSKLCTKIYCGDITPEEFVRMTAAEMQSEDLKSKDSRCIQDSLLASQIASTAADTDMFKCSRCKERKCTYTQLQTRSCDEPMTTFVTCTVCGNRWKF